MSKIKYWIPAMIIMVIIFLGSNDPVSGEKSDFITCFIWKIITMITGQGPTPEQEAATGFVIRKLAHISEYLFLALSYYYAIRQSWPIKSFKGSYLLAFIFAFLYAVSDEIHQTFIPGRVGTYEDVLVDSVGICLGYLILYLSKQRFFNYFKSVF